VRRPPIPIKECYPLHTVTARDKVRVCTGIVMEFLISPPNRRNSFRVHVSYCAFLRAWAVRPNCRVCEVASAGTLVNTTCFLSSLLT
jgi:hypothetical protein